MIGIRRMMKRETYAVRITGNPNEKLNRSRKYHTAEEIPPSEPDRELADGKIPDVVST